jgi:hypothetical protein
VQQTDEGVKALWDASDGMGTFHALPFGGSMQALLRTCGQE